MLLGLPFDSWFWFIGVRLLCCLVGLVGTVFGIYEGRKKDALIEKNTSEKDSWYWTF